MSIKDMLQYVVQAAISPCSVQGSTSGREGETPQKECYVKWKGKSHMHCTWVAFNDIQASIKLPPMPPAARTKLRRLLSESDNAGKVVGN